MSVVERGAQHGTNILIRQVESHLTILRAVLRGADLDLAERLAVCLRELVIETTSSSAADRARVRAAVHHFVLRRDTRGPRSLTATRQVVNRIVVHLDRPDLVIVSEEDGVGDDPMGPTRDISAG